MISLLIIDFKINKNFAMKHTVWQMIFCSAHI